MNTASDDKFIWEKEAVVWLESPTHSTTQKEINFHTILIQGGGGSGNFGHAGRPGAVGGSGESEGVGSDKKPTPATSIEIGKNRSRRLDNPDKVIQWTSPRRAKLPTDSMGRQTRGWNEYKDWNVYLGAIHPKNVSPDIPLTENVRNHWKENKSELGHANLRGLTEKDVISILSSAKRGEASVGVNRWGDFASFKIKPGAPTTQKEINFHTILIQGGGGSGNFGHAGRPGAVGGSGGGGGRDTTKTIADSLGLSQQQGQELEEYWNTHLSKEIDKLFNEGSATCTVATGKMGKWLEKQGLSVQYVSGEFQGSGHWWNVVSVPNLSVGKGMYSRHIVDFGNNISKEAINTGHISPSISKFGSEQTKQYKSEETMSRTNFLKEMKSQGYKQSAFTIMGEIQ